MNRFLTTLAISSIVIPGFSADMASLTLLPEGALTAISVERSASSLHVSMNINPEVFSKKSNRETVIRPVVVDGTDSLWLRPVVVAGRTRYFQNLREDDTSYILLRAGNRESYAYSETAAFAEWMLKGRLEVVTQIDGCCGDGLTVPAESNLLAFDFREKELRPSFAYVKPSGELVKERHVDGKAYIDFPVNRVEILQDFRNNPKELREIQRTIDEVRNDQDVTITSLSIKGFASPEGSYAGNERLAKGRTESLMKYVSNLYSFPANVMHSSWVAEDWEGLAERVSESDIANKDAILAVVNDVAMEPDARDAALRHRFPEQYQFMLANWYPSLRHSDYNVQFVVRNYTDPAEIARIMKTAPQKLSLEELFIYAQSLDKDSPEFQEVMEVAVRMFPDDPIANLNAATTAVAHGEYDMARQYLTKATDMPERYYTEGVLEAKTGNYTKAAALLQAAEHGGIADARRLLDDMTDWGWITPQQ